MNIIALYKNNLFLVKQLIATVPTKIYMLFSRISIFSFAQNCKKALKFSLCLLFFIQVCVSSNAQGGSLMQELSYPFLEKLIFTAKQNYPRVKSNYRRVNIANMNLQKANLSWFDFFSFSAFYSPNTSVTLTNQTLTGIQIGLFVNIASIIQKPIIVKQSKEELEIAKLAADEYLLTIEADVKSRYFRYLQAVTSLRVRNQVLIDIEALYKQVKYKFERGESTFENYNISLVSLAKQKQDIIEAEAAVLIAKSSLEELVGVKLEVVK